jgi:hypothetical protein
MIAAAQVNAHRQRKRLCRPTALSAQGVVGMNSIDLRPPPSGSRLAISNRPDRNLRDDERRAHPFLVPAIHVR